MDADQIKESLQCINDYLLIARQAKAQRQTIKSNIFLQSFHSPDFSFTYLCTARCFLFPLIWRIERIDFFYYSNGNSNDVDRTFYFCIYLFEIHKFKHADEWTKILHELIMYVECVRLLLMQEEISNNFKFVDFKWATKPIYYPSFQV